MTACNSVVAGACCHCHSARCGAVAQRGTEADEFRTRVRAVPLCASRMLREGIGGTGNRRAGRPKRGHRFETTPHGLVEGLLKLVQHTTNLVGRCPTLYRLSKSGTVHVFAAQKDRWASAASHKRPTSPQRDASVAVAVPRIGANLDGAT